jgi:diguanylate cyclase (GGDEF)-like protein
MSQDRPVLVLSRDAARAEAWQRALAAAGIETVTRDDLFLEAVEPVLSVDVGVVLLDDIGLRQGVRLPLQRWERGEIGTLLVGGSGPADVQLPADATPREIVLACRMLDQIVALRRQLRQEERQQRVLRTAAATDSLTGLANRRAWDEMLQRLAHSSASSTAQDGVTVLALLDIDGFKRWNAEFGHALADQQLISVAERLTAAVRRDDFVFRWGGDEFAVLITGIDSSVSGTLVERIRDAAGLLAPRSLTLSAGWAIVPCDEGKIAAALAFREADSQLRLAKSLGGNRSSPG